MRTKDSRAVLRGLGRSNAPRLPGALAEWQRQYEAGGKPNAKALKKQFNAIRKEQFPWTYEVTKCAVEGAFMDVAAAFKNFFEGQQAGRKTGYPKFKSKKHSRQSFYLDWRHPRESGLFLSVEPVVSPVRFPARRSPAN